MQLKADDFERILNFKFSNKAKDIINLYKIELQDLTKDELSEQIQIIKSFLDEKHIIKAGPHRINDWNNGWNENNIEFEKTKNIDSLIPKYFGKYEYVRIDNKFKKTLNKNCELNMLRVLQIFLLEKYCSNVENFYEFGCGTGHNLFAISEYNKKGNYFGFDWTNPPRDIFANINKYYNKNFIFNNFDFTAPNYDIKLNKNSAIFTFAALEQVGEKNEEFIKFLIHNKAGLCIHLEPVSEILSKDDELQNLSIKYMEKRNYLSNFYNNLKKFENDNKIKIIDVARTTIGSYYLEGYSLIVWEAK